MDDGGYVFEHRSVMEHAVFQDDWLYRLFRWCIMKANYTPGKFHGTDVPVGSFITGKIRGAEELGVHPSKFFRGIHLLTEKPYEVITITANRNWTMITVVNYRIYQLGAASGEPRGKAGREPRLNRAKYKADKDFAADQNGTSEPPANRQRTADEPPANTIEESNKSIRQEGNKDHTLWPDGHEANEATATDEGSGTAEATTDQSQGSKATPTYPDLFEAFWNAYPPRGGRRRGKDKCFDIWRREVPAAERQAIINAAKAYARTGDVRRGYAKDPERFLTKNWWRSFLEPAEGPDFEDDPRGNAAVVRRYLAGESDG